MVWLSFPEQRPRALQGARDWGLVSETWTVSVSQLVGGWTRKAGCCPLCGPVLLQPGARQPAEPDGLGSNPVLLLV